MILRPGDNELNMRATTDMATLMSEKLTILKAQPNALKEGAVIQSRGRSVTYKGQRIPYFEAIMAPLVLETKIPIMSLLKEAMAAKPMDAPSSSGALGGL